MKWILVWWVIHPWHTQAMHIERGFASEESCQRYAAMLPVHNGIVRWHCSVE
jgi:hypothetical protein